MTHKERVLRALNHEETDRPPFQATFTPEFADRLRREFHLPEQRTEPHHRTWYGYDLEILTGQDALQAGGGWVTNYYLRPENYTDEWGVEWKIDPYQTPYGTGHYTNIARNPLRDDDDLALQTAFHVFAPFFFHYTREERKKATVARQKGEKTAKIHLDERES